MTERIARSSCKHLPERSATGAKIVELDLRQPGPGELCVRNHYCRRQRHFRHADRAQRGRLCEDRLPTLTGVEALGIVEAVGEGVVDFAVGDAVVTTRFPGGYREVNIAPEDAFRKSAGGQTAVAGARLHRRLGSDGAGPYRRGKGRRNGRHLGGGGRPWPPDRPTWPTCAAATSLRCAAARPRATSCASLGAHRVIDYRTEVSRRACSPPNIPTSWMSR